MLQLNHRAFFASGSIVGAPSRDSTRGGRGRQRDRPVSDHNLSLNYHEESNC